MTDEQPPATGRSPRDQRRSRDPGGRRGRWLRVARVVWLVGLAGLLAWLIWTRRSGLAGLVSTARPGWLVVALVLAAGQIVPSVGLWTAALRALGQRVSVGAVASATARSLPARYVPGSVWYALGRAGLLRRGLGLSKAALGTVAAVETLLVVVVAIGLGAGLLGISGQTLGAGAAGGGDGLLGGPGDGLGAGGGRPLGLSGPVWLAGWFVVLMAVTSPPVINAVLGRWTRRRGLAPLALSWAAWARLVAAAGAHWVWSAATFVVYLAAFPGLELGSVLAVAGAFMVAWAVGFLAVFAPQGAGVFEVVVAGLLVSSGTATVAVIAAGYRALILVRDAVLFGWAWLAGRISRDIPDS